MRVVYTICMNNADVYCSADKEVWNADKKPRNVSIAWK